MNLRLIRIGSFAISLALLVALSSASKATQTSGSFMRPATERADCQAEHQPALVPRRFAFPRDDGAHDAYAVEWWRTFGRITDGSGKRFDFSVNVSRFAIAPRSQTLRAIAGRWFSRRVVATSYALIDEDTLEVKRGTFVDREGSLGATISSGGLFIVSRAIRYTQSAHTQNHAAHLSLSIHDADAANALSLEQTPMKAALPLGPGGIMRTGSCASNAAYAYAYTRNATSGVLRFDGIDYRVSGSTWFEHEFAQHELATEDAGWDRFEVQFDDGRDVDARFTRDADGRVITTSGAFVAADGKVTYLTTGTARTTLPPDAKPRDAIWHSVASDVTYPAMWFFLLKPGHLALATVETTHDQEIRAPERTPYYWGAIVVEKYGPPGGDSGHGFVELTGYGGRLAL